MIATPPRSPFRKFARPPSNAQLEHRIPGGKRVVHHFLEADELIPGEGSTVAGTVQDITDRKRAEEQIRRAGVLRQSHRAPEPPPSRRSPGQGAGMGETLRNRRGSPVHRPGPLQAGQRHAGTHGGRPGPQGGGRAAALFGALRRLPGKGTPGKGGAELGLAVRRRRVRRGSLGAPGRAGRGTCGAAATGRICVDRSRSSSRR